MLEYSKGLVKATIRHLQKRRRGATLKHQQPHTTRAQMAEDLHRLGVEAADILLVHSSLKSLGYVEGGPGAVIGALLDAVGPEGTLMLPTYYMPGGTIHTTCQKKGYVFDPRVHGTGLGAIPSAFLRFPGVKRSVHPTHSVSALGKYAKYLTEAHHRAPSTFGAGSPWQRWVEVGGKALGLGVSLAPVAIYHYLEDNVGDEFPIPIKLPEIYNIKCRDWSGNLIDVPVNPYDPQYVVGRRVDHKERDDLREYFWKEFNRAGLLTVGKVGQAVSWIAGSRQFYDHLYLLMKQNITIYSTSQQIKARPIY